MVISQRGKTPFAGLPGHVPIAPPPRAVSPPSVITHYSQLYERKAMDRGLFFFLIGVPLPIIYFFCGTRILVTVIS